MERQGGWKNLPWGPVLLLRTDTAVPLCVVITMYTKNRYFANFASMQRLQGPKEPVDLKVQ